MDEFLLEEILGSNGPLSGEKIKKVSGVSGGCIHAAWKIELKTGEIFFAKTNSPEFYEILKFESLGLETLIKYTDLSLLLIPTPLHIQKLEGAAILVMPWINMKKNDETNLGKGLASLHKFSSSRNNGLFGWPNDGFIGSGPQPKGLTKSWGECFVNLRLIPQLRIAENWGLKQNQYSILIPKLIEHLNDHNPSPSIVHGDLWKGNCGMNQDGRGVIFDPAIWWADREVDMAMTKLFGGFSRKFYEAYEEIWPLENSALKRVDIYNLYHILNHANIFGGSYKSQCISNLARLKNLFIN